MHNSTKYTVDIAIWITLGAVLLYVAGWSYAYHWFGYFQLGLIHMGLPTEYHLMYGFWVLRDHWWLFLMLFLSASFTWIFRPGPMPWLRWWILPMLIAIFMLIYDLGERSANNDFRQHSDTGFDRHPWTRVWLTPKTKSDPRLTSLAEDLAAGHYRLLVQSETSLFLIKPKKGAQISTVQVPLEQVAATRRMPVNPGNYR